MKLHLINKTNKAYFQKKNAKRRDKGREKEAGDIFKA